MFKILKYLKPFMVSIITVVALLVVQAVCDLSLPDYTSNIVNVGIQQSGIENAVPSIIRESELNKLTLFMNESEKNKVKDSYDLLDKNKLSKEDYEKEVEKYPALKNESLYKLNTKDEETINNLNSIMSKAIMRVSGIKMAS